MSSLPTSPRYHRHHRVRARVGGTAARPRLVIFRSLKHIYLQLIDDSAQRTLVSAADRELSAPIKSKIEQAAAVGELLAKRAVAKNITTVVFDRGGYRYHGRVKAVAEGARRGGLIF